MKRFRFKTLQSQIFVFFFLLILATQLGSIVVTSTLGLAIVNQTLGEELETAKRVFVHLFDQNTAFLTQGARILAADYGFREAVASRDGETIASALDNQGGRIEADLMLFVGLDGQITPSAATPQAIDPRQLDWLNAQEPQRNPTVLIERIQGRLYQLITVPVAAPLPIGAIVAGFRIDAGLARDIGTITHTDVSYVSRHPDGEWTVHASTLDGAPLDALDAALGSGGIGAERISKIATDADAYLSLRARLPSPDGQQSFAVLQKSLDASLAPFRDLRDRLLMLGAFGLLLSGLLSLAIARGVTRPIQALAGFAQRIAQGNYGEKPVIDGRNEIAELAHAFEHMSTEIASREAYILDLAYRDVLTGLPNRTMFHDRLQQALHASRRVGKPLTVLLLGLDRFKYVNDTLGHPIGDLLLKEVAQRLQATLRRASDTVSRLGGDEFAVLLPTEGPDPARKVARALLDALEQPMTLDGQIIDMRGSIGIASAPLHGDDITTLLRCANVALHEAKRTGSGYAEYDARHDHNTLARLSLMSELRDAVENNHLALFYQPKIDLKDNNTHSAEALVRWVHPQRGVVPPNDFIPFAEQTGYIKAITTWVLNEGVRQCAEWTRMGLAVNISINLSARDLMNAELPDYFAGLIQQHGCEAQRICLEITESAILDDPGHALENLRRLDAIGCKLSIDDYGTGYSSLAYLKQLPVNELKIDRSFVKNMVNDASDRVIVRSTIDLAHNLGLHVVAEGVENEAILSELCLLGCDQAQGYLFSKPVSATDYYAWVQGESWKAPLRQARAG